MTDLFVSTTSFCEFSKDPLNLLKANKIKYILNNKKRKLEPEEAFNDSMNCKYLIAGTENLEFMVRHNNNLQLICRLGVGIENVPVELLKKKEIALSHTPIGLYESVSELTLSHILTLLRNVPLLDKQLRCGTWNKIIGKSISDSKIGIIGFGRIGIQVKKLIRSLSDKQILIHDKNKSNFDKEFVNDKKIKFVDLNYLLQNSDVVTLHLPLTKDTYNYISKKELEIMKSDAIIINTSRGGIVNELDLFKHLSLNQEFSAGIDVFEEEPYKGPMKELDNILISPHIGSSTKKSRYLMEVSAVKEVINFHNGKSLKYEIM